MVPTIKSASKNRSTDIINNRKEEKMAYKDSSDFRREYPGGYSKDGEVFDGNGNKIGYVCGDGDYRTTEKGPNEGQLYHNH